MPYGIEHDNLELAEHGIPAPNQNRCKTCKWWERINRKVYGMCDSESWKKKITIIYFYPYTHKDFGCIFHEERTDD